MPLSSIVLTDSNCIEGPKVRHVSWVDKIMMEVGLIGNNSWEQFRKEQDINIISKVTLDRMYQCKGGF